MQKKHSLKNKKGAAMVEYIALLGLIGVVTVTVALDFGWNLRGTFATAENTLIENIGLDSPDDGTLETIEEIPEIPEDPFGGMFPPPEEPPLGGPIDGDYMVMDGCAVHGPSGDYVWCPGPNPPVDSEIDAPHSVANGGFLEFRSRNGEECVYDTTPGVDTWVMDMIGMFGGGPDPANNDDLTCQAL